MQDYCRKQWLNILIMIKLYKYQGAGNDFLIADNRSGCFSCKDGVLSCESLDGKVWSRRVEDLCDRHYGIGADGLMLLENADGCDFRMVYFNSDGSGGMMCGNGGRCIVAFAADLGIESYDFIAADGMHSAQIIEDDQDGKVIRLKMKDVSEVVLYDSLEGLDCGGYFLDTGTRHFVTFVDEMSKVDVFSQGRKIRYGAKEFLPLGVNVNFVQPDDAGLLVRTYEKGVEQETYACGTGIVASCVAAFLWGFQPCGSLEQAADFVCGDRVHYRVAAKRDILEVDFLPGDIRNGGFVASDVWLTGPAVCVGEIMVY